MANESSTNDVKYCASLREKIDKQRASLDHSTLVRSDLKQKLDAANRDLARVRGLLQRTAELLKQSLPTLRWAVDLEFDSTRLDDLNHLVEVGRLLGEIDRLAEPPNFQQSSSLASQGAESADMGKLYAADKKGCPRCNGALDFPKKCTGCGLVLCDMDCLDWHIEKDCVASAETGGEKA